MLSFATVHPQRDSREIGENPPRRHLPRALPTLLAPPTAVMRGFPLDLNPERHWHDQAETARDNNRIIAVVYLIFLSLRLVPL